MDKRCFVLLAVPLLVAAFGVAVRSQTRQSEYDEIVNQFIAYDVGQLRGEAGARANAAFRDLSGDEAIPALVRGVNRAARINNSCPIIVISGKLQRMLSQTTNQSMLGYAFDHLNASGQGVVYGSYVKSLRQFADRRLAALTGGKPRIKRELRGGGTASQLRRSQTPIDEWSYEDLVEAVGQEKGAELVRVLEEMKKRKGAKYTAAMTEAARRVDDDMKSVALGLLAQRLVRMTDRTLQAALKHSNDQLRAAAAMAVGYKGSPLYDDLAMVLRDSNPVVATNAHNSLVKLLGEDLGPGDGASYAEWFAASKRWEKFLEDRRQSRPSGER